MLQLLPQLLIFLVRRRLSGRMLGGLTSTHKPRLKSVYNFHRFPYNLL